MTEVPPLWFTACLLALVAGGWLVMRLIDKALLP